MDRELRLLDPLADAETRLDSVWSHYENECATTISRPPTPIERRAVLDWMRQERVSGNWASLLTKRPVLLGAAYYTVVEKASTLRQQSCLACEPVMLEGGQFPVNISFGIDVEPWAAQSKRNRVKIREAVTAELKRTNHLKLTSYNFCVTVVSLVKHCSRRKDADNLVKGLLDSMQGVLYVNDSQIQCLKSQRLEYSGPAGAYFVSATAVRPWADDVVLDDGRPPKFL